MKRKKFDWKIIIFLLIIVILLMTLLNVHLFSSNIDGLREAKFACEGSKPNDPCSFSHHDTNIKGTCMDSKRDFLVCKQGA